MLHSHRMQVQVVQNGFRRRGPFFDLKARAGGVKTCVMAADEKHEKIDDELAHYGRLKAAATEFDPHWYRVKSTGTNGVPVSSGHAGLSA